MSDSSVTSILYMASVITKLNGPDDWLEWNRELRGHLGMVDLWATLIGEVPAPAKETTDYQIWQSHQRKLASLLLLITGPSALSLIELKSDDTATEQYCYLKSMYNTTTITTYSSLYRRINRCSISNHKTLKEYGEEVTKARNNLKELKRPVDELHVTCAFLDGLDSSYQAWKDMYLASYAKNLTGTAEGVEGVMIVPTIEEVLKLLIDRESRTASTSPSSQSSTRAFNAKGRNSRPPARGEKSSNSRGQLTPRYCETCYSTTHKASNCWYTHIDKANEKFKTAHPNANAIKKALEETRRVNNAWEKAHPRKGLTAAKISTTGRKDKVWYLDSAASVHATYVLQDSVYPDLDKPREEIEIANGDVLRTRGDGTVAIERGVRW